MFIYEIYYETQGGTVVYCQDTDCELDAIDEIRKLTIEFPQNYYWYEAVLGED